MQPNGPQSSPFVATLGDPIVNGKYVGLRAGAYDPGYTVAMCYALLNGEIVKIDVTPHHVELVNGVSSGKKTCMISINDVEIDKVNVPSGAGLYGCRGVSVKTEGQLDLDLCANDGPLDGAKNPTLLWHQSTITGSPLAGIKPFNVANLRALLGGGGGSGADPNAIHDGDVVKVVRQ